jgi:hypothetical protein
MKINELPHMIVADLLFNIGEKPHLVFTEDGNEMMDSPEGEHDVPDDMRCAYWCPMQSFFVDLSLTCNKDFRYAYVLSLLTNDKIV